MVLEADLKGIKFLKNKFARNKKDFYFCTRNNSEVLTKILRGLEEKKVFKKLSKTLASKEKVIIFADPKGIKFLEKL